MKQVDINRIAEEVERWLTAEEVEILLQAIEEAPHALAEAIRQNIYSYELARKQYDRTLTVESHHPE